ncbi:MAG: hypothetical protein ACRYF0_07600 [Janthinobacterium lividum]
MGRFFERYLPLLAALAITAGTWRYLRSLPVADVGPLFSTFISASLTITTTLLGFLLTIYTIFQSIDTPRKRFLVQLGQLSTLNHYLIIAVWALLGAAVLLLSFTLIPVKPPILPDYWRYTQLGLIFVTAFSIACSTRFINIFLRLMVDNSK